MSDNCESIMNNNCSHNQLLVNNNNNHTNKKLSTRKVQFVDIANSMDNTFNKSFNSNNINYNNDVSINFNKLYTNNMYNFKYKFNNNNNSLFVNDIYDSNNNNNSFMLKNNYDLHDTCINTSMSDSNIRYNSNLNKPDNLYKSTACTNYNNNYSNANILNSFKSNKSSINNKCNYNKNNNESYFIRKASLYKSNDNIFNFTSSENCRRETIVSDYELEDITINNNKDNSFISSNNLNNNRINDITNSNNNITNINSDNSPNSPSKLKSLIDRNINKFNTFIKPLMLFKYNMSKDNSYSNIKNNSVCVGNYYVDKDYYYKNLDFNNKYMKLFCIMYYIYSCLCIIISINMMIDFEVSSLFIIFSFSLGINSGFLTYVNYKEKYNYLVRFLNLYIN